MLKYYNSFYCNSFSVIVRRRRSDRAPSSGRSERSERDTSANGGSGATVRNHRQGASGAMRIIGSEGSRRRSRANEVSVSTYTHHRTEGARSRAGGAIIGRGSERSERDITTYFRVWARFMHSGVNERRASEREEPEALSWYHCNARAQTKNRTDVRVDATKTSAKTIRARLWPEPHGRAQGRACVRAVAGEHAKRNPWDNISREQQPQPRDASIKYNENYATANEVERKK